MLIFLQYIAVQNKFYYKNKNAILFNFFSQEEEEEEDNVSLQFGIKNAETLFH